MEENEFQAIKKIFNENINKIGKCDIKNDILYPFLRDKIKEDVNRILMQDLQNINLKIKDMIMQL